MCFWMMIAHDQKDDTSSKTMTAFTMKGARQNSARKEKSKFCAAAFKTSVSIDLLYRFGCIMQLLFWRADNKISWHLPTNLRDSRKIWRVPGASFCPDCNI
jgi:hypothetical protein